MGNKDKKLIKKIIVRGNIQAVTGLHIGGSNMTLQIGGVDNEIVKNAEDGMPYIPGSSLKGKMRSLLEQSLGEIGSAQGRLINHGPSKIGKVPLLFGRTDDKNHKEITNVPSRVIFRDCFVSDKDFFKKAKNLDLPFSEVKTEIVLDRITASATPRQIERVPAGVKFGFEVVLNVFEGKEEFEELPEEEAVKMLFGGMQLLQEDYLGGSGSRGSGQIKFLIDNVFERNVDSYYIKNEIKDVEYTKVSLPEKLRAKQKTEKV